MDTIEQPLWLNLGIKECDSESPINRKSLLSLNFTKELLLQLFRWCIRAIPTSYDNGFSGIMPCKAKGQFSECWKCGIAGFNDGKRRLVHLPWYPVLKFSFGGNKAAIQTTCDHSAVYLHTTELTKNSTRGKTLRKTMFLLNEPIIISR